MINVLFLHRSTYARFVPHEQSPLIDKILSLDVQPPISFGENLYILITLLASLISPHPNFENRDARVDAENTPPDAHQISHSPDQ